MKKRKFFAQKMLRAKYSNATMQIDLGKVENGLQCAQYRLDNAVMQSMIPYMPKQTGTFINVTQGMSQAIAGSGKVVAAAPPMGRYLYEGKVMVDAETGKGPQKIPIGPGDAYLLRFRKGAKLKATDRPLQYSKHANPKATDHWFEAARERDEKAWIRIAQKGLEEGMKK